MKILSILALQIYLLCSCASSPRGKSFIKSRDSLPRRLNYLRHDELVALGKMNGMEKSEVDLLPIGGRLIYKGIHYHNSMVEKGSDRPYLRVKDGEIRKRLKCHQTSSVVVINAVTKQIKSKVTCDILETVPGCFSVELRESETNVLETFEVYPDSIQADALRY